MFAARRFIEGGEGGYIFKLTHPKKQNDHTHTHARTQNHARTYVYRYTLTHARTHNHARTYVYRYTLTHAHTHTHTHTQETSDTKRGVS